MIIRSQDKKRIANIGTCNLIDIIDSCKNTKHIIVDGMVIGTYATEEKAVKVLDMIQDAYMGSAKWMITYNGKMQQSTVPVVFQMPQDSEV